jgi:hypothetical protein
MVYLHTLAVIGGRGNSRPDQTQPTQFGVVFQKGLCDRDVIFLLKMSASPGEEATDISERIWWVM